MNILKNKINTNKLGPKTTVYLLGVVVFFIFWYFFGTTNALIGFVLIHASIMLFNKDLTANPIKNIFKFAFTYFCVGIFSFIATQNMYLGFIINFSVIFFICYAFFYNLKTSIWAPFIFTYLILLHNSISVSELPVRLIGLSLGSLFIIGSQFIINRHRARHDLKANFQSLIKEISMKVHLLVNNKDFKNQYNDAEKYIEKIVTIINDRRDDIFYLNNLDNIRLNFALYIERLNFSINALYHDTSDKLYVDFLLDLSISINKINNFMQRENSSSILIKELDEFTKNYGKLLSYNYSAYEMIQNISMLRFAVVNFANNKGKEKTNIINYFKISKILIVKDIIKLNFNFKSLRFAYAFKFAFLLSASFFFAKFLHLQYGYWITATLFAVLRPRSEVSNERGILRFKGTVVGVLIFVLIDLSILHTPVRIIIFLILYYFFLLFKSYDFKIACITPMVLTLLTLMGRNPYETSIFRLIYMAIGLIIAYFATKYFLPFNSKDALKKHMKAYYNLSKEMLNFEYNSLINEVKLKDLYNKLLLGKLYEDKIILNNEATKINCVKDFVYNQRILLNNIYFLFYSLHRAPINDVTLNNFKNAIASIYDNSKGSINYDEDALLNKISYNIKNNFKDIKTYEEKMISVNICRVILRLQRSKNLIKEFYSNN